MKRRGFLGFLGGAAAASPSIAKSAVASLPAGMGGVGGGFGTVEGLGRGLGTLTAETTMDGMKRDWRIDQVASLRRLIAGEYTEEELEERYRRRLENRQTLISQNVASLRSVSDVRKVELFNRRILAHADDLNRHNSRSYLAQLLKEMSR